MPSYIPDYVFGSIRDSAGYHTGAYGLVPWPAHLQPERSIELTKKGEAYAVSFSMDRLAFENDYPLPVSRRAIEDRIQALIDMLDIIDDDPDIEDGADAEPEETDCNLAGGYSDLEFDYGEYDSVMPIWGGGSDGAQEMRP